MRRFGLSLLIIMHELLQQATAGSGGVQTGSVPTAGSPAPDVNSTQARPEPGMEWPAAGEDLPDQMGGVRTTLMPGIDTFKMPPDISRMWKDIDAKDNRKFLPSGQPNQAFGQVFKRKQLKFDRNSPLVVVGGPRDGEPMTATFSTNPRPRGKADDVKTAWISDVAYLLDIAIGDKSRPQDVNVTVAKINAAAAAGKTIRLEHGLTAQCRPDKVRYIPIVTQEPTGQVDAQGQQVMRQVEGSIMDPTGQKGCNRGPDGKEGGRYYTKDFQIPANERTPNGPEYDLELVCNCGAVLRAFENVERILPPLGS